MGINGFIEKFSISGFSARNSIKAVTGADDLYTDEEGKHVIFRNVGGRVRPIHVGPEDYAEWLVNQNVSIDPADQKTLREIDKELEIMEKAAQYGGSALQKKYEDYFNQRRAQYNQISSNYYQQALQNQAQANQTSVKDLLERKKKLYDAHKDKLVKRSELPNKGWDSSIRRWVESQDSKYKLTSANDDWYYTRLYGVILSELVESAKGQVHFSDLDLNKVFSNEFFDKSLQNHYAKYFSDGDADPKKVIAAVKTMQKYFLKDAKGTRKTMENFVAYWYNKMEKDFEPDYSGTLSTGPNTSIISDVSQGVVPKTLPKTFNKLESRALIAMYDRAAGSKLSASHRVLMHGISRLIESIPQKDRVSSAVSLADGTKGLHAAHREGYDRAFTNNESLGISEDKKTLIQNALKIIEDSASGTSKQKVAALKRVAMIMGTIDGEAVLSANPGIQKQQFSKKWSNSATNAGRAKSEGPGLIDLLTDDSIRDRHTYTNDELKIIHSEDKDQDEVSLVFGDEDSGVKKEPEKVTSETTEDESSDESEEASFRVPLFDFPQNLTTEDRKALDTISEYVTKKDLSLDKVSAGIYRIQKRTEGGKSNRYVDILYNKNKNRLIGISRDDAGKILPIPSLSLAEIEKMLDDSSGLSFMDDDTLGSLIKNKEEVIWRRPEYIKAAKKNKNYKLKELEDGSVQLVGVKGKDGWIELAESN